MQNKNQANYLNINAPRVTFAFLLLLALIPLLVFAEAPIAAQFWPAPVLFLTLGKALGLVGLALFALTMLLSARYVWLDRLFAGLPRAIKVHRWFGVFSFVFVLLHPLFLAFSYLPVSPALSWDLFTNFSQLDYFLGYAAILSFMAIIFITLFMRLKYEKLKSLHSLMAIPLMLGGAHSLLMSSDVARHGWLTAYFIVLISVAIAAYLSRLLLITLNIKSRPFALTAVDHPTERTTRLRLKPLLGAFKFNPGQFIFVRLVDIDKNEEHPFSITAAVGDKEIEVIAKNLGDFTAKLGGASVGSLAYVDGPYGSFSAALRSRYPRKQVWIAGGIGITPFLGMARSLRANGQAGAVDMHYVVAASNDLVNLKELETIAAAMPEFNVKTFSAKDQGRFTIEKTGLPAEEMKQLEYFICGPPGLISSLVSQLRARHVPARQIHLEAFQLL